MTLDLRRTPVLDRMYTLLSDGMIHSKEELHECLYDPLSDFPDGVQMNLSRLRKLIEPYGQDIFTKKNIDGKVGYVLALRISRR